MKKVRTEGRRIADAHYREITRVVRDFLKYSEQHPQHLFSLGTQRFLEEVRPIVEQLDARESLPRS